MPKGTLIGTDAKPLVLGKKRRRPNVTSQAYRDNFDNIFSKKERKCPILEKYWESKQPSPSKQLQEDLEPIE